MPSKSKVVVKADVHLKAYEIISDAVSAGVKWGTSRAHKHTDTPSPEAVEESIVHHVMLTLSEVLDFGDT